MGNKFSEVFQSDEFREELFVAGAQARLASLLEEKGVSRAELARKLDVSRARVTQIFSDEAKNFTLRLLARSFFALDEEPVILSKKEYDRLVSQRPSNPGEGSGKSRAGAKDTLTSSLIADLLRASELVNSEQDKTRRADSTREWAQGGSNVVPIRRASHA